MELHNSLVFLTPKELAYVVSLLTFFSFKGDVVMESIYDTRSGTCGDFVPDGDFHGSDTFKRIEIVVVSYSVFFWNIPTNSS